MSLEPVFFGRQDHPLYGRAADLGLLHRWFDNSLTGRPVVGVLSGEAGIGKTALLRSFLTSCATAGAYVAAASCFEGSAAPYFSISSALARLQLSWPKVRSLRDHADAEVIVSVADQVLDRARRRPLVIALDDWQWADRESVEFVSHLAAVARHVATSDHTQLMLVLCTRVDGSEHPGESNARRLQQDPDCHTLLLRGLDELATTALLTQMLGQRPGQKLVAETLDITSGNPLHIEALMQRAAARRVLADAGGAVRTTGPLSPHLQLSDFAAAWNDRLEPLRRSERELLEIAAVLGDGLLEHHLRAVLDPSANVGSDLDALERAALLVGDGERVFFRHPTLRRAVLSSLSERRRRAVHGRIARALDATDLEQDVNASVLVWHHARRAFDPDCDHITDRLAPVVAQHARELGAWSTAAEALDDTLRAIRVESSVAPTELELAAGKVRYHLHDFVEAVPHLQRAIESARESRDLTSWGEALFFLTGAHIVQQTHTVPFALELVDEFLQAAGQDAADHQAKVLANIAQYHFGRFDVAAGQVPLARAIELAEQGSIETRHFVSTTAGLNAFGRLDLPEALRHFVRAVALIDGHEDPWQAVWVQIGLPLVALLEGDFKTVESYSRTGLETAITTQQWNLHGLGAACLAAASLARGELADAERWARDAISSYQRSDYFYAAAIGYPHAAASRAVRGDFQGARHLLDEWSAIAGPLVERHYLMTDALAGDVDAINQRLSDHPPRLPTEPDLFSIGLALAMVESALVANNAAVLESARTHLIAAAGKGIAFGIEWCVGIERAIASAFTALDELDRAEQWFARASLTVERSGSDLERARLAVWRAIAQLRRGASPADVRAPLQAALDYYNDRHLLALAGELKRWVPEDVFQARSRMVVCYTDLVDSTRLNVRVGDTTFVELLREHNVIVRRRLSDYGGMEFTYTGDGVGARFTDVDAALGFATGLQAELDDANARHKDSALHVRIGLAWGDALENDNNYFGVDVLRAVRICAAAGAGEVLVSQEVAEGCDSTLTTLTDRGSIVLKGFDDQEHKVYLAQRQLRQSSEITDDRSPDGTAVQLR